MLSPRIKSLFQPFGYSVESTADLVSGVKLAALINSVFYGGHNQTFENKIIREN